MVVKPALYPEEFVTLGVTVRKSRAYMGKLLLSYQGSDKKKRRNTTMESQWKLIPIKGSNRGCFYYLNNVI